MASIVTETPSVKTFRLVPEGSESSMPFTFVPGQFLNVAFSIGGARMNRSNSISSSPTEHQHVELTVRREPRGSVSRHINDLMVVGDQIETGGAGRPLHVLRYRRGQHRPEGAWASRR